MPDKKSSSHKYQCSFCGKSQEQVHRLIAGPDGVYICNECIDLCREIIEEEQGQARTPSPKPLVAKSAVPGGGPCRILPLTSWRAIIQKSPGHVAASTRPLLVPRRSMPGRNS